MKDLGIKLRITFFAVSPYVFTIWAWGWWWLLWTTLILLACNWLGLGQGKKVVSAVLTGIALVTVSAVVGFPSATLLSGYLYSVIYWVICFLIA